MLKNSDPALKRSFETARERHQRGDLEGAEAIYSRLLALDPADDELLFLFGNLKAGKGEIDLGLECLRLAQQLSPSDQKIPFSIGIVLQGVGRSADAAEAYRETVAISPDFLAAWENLCVACYDMGDYLSGLGAAERALALNRESPLALRGTANCLAALGRRAEALEVLNEGLRYHPALPELRIHRSWELMANGRFDEAWPELEWRYARCAENDAQPRSAPCARWNGEAPAGKTILVYGEQGIGDEVMFAPYIRGFVGAGAKCILECEPRLAGVFARSFPECTILKREDRDQVLWHAEWPEVDYCVSSLSLPLYFPHSFDGHPFLAADRARVNYWRSRLDALSPGLKVGVSWRGGGNNSIARKIRSIPPAVFGELIDAGATFVSVQYGATEAEIAAVSPGLMSIPEVDALRDLDDFIALLSALDAVVSIDNSTVHIAGALGVRTLLLLPVFSEWRWGDRPFGVSPWYRSVEFVRQSVASDQGWRSVIGQARQWLSACSRSDPQASLAMSEHDHMPAAEVLVMPAQPGQTALVVGDTNYWSDWGCSCASIALHEGLRARFDTIAVLPVAQLLSGIPLPAGAASLDADDFFTRFAEARPDIVAAFERASSVIINGEDFLRETSPLALALLYLAYIAKKRFGRKVAIVNHSCRPGGAVLADGTPVVDFYARVYKTLDLAVVRDRSSFDRARRFGGKVCEGFDCLPLFLARHQPRAFVQRQKLVLCGSAGLGAELVDALADLSGWAVAHGLSIEILSGAKAFLAPDEVDFVGAVVRVLDARRIAHTVHFPLSEAEWLEAIGSSSLVVSGRLRCALAAAFQRIPFLIVEGYESDSGGGLDELGLDPRSVTLKCSEFHEMVRKASRLLDDRSAVPAPERLDEMRVRAGKNFSLW